VKLAQRDAIRNRRAEGQGYMREGLQPRATLRRLDSFSRLLGGAIRVVAEYRRPGLVVRGKYEVLVSLSLRLNATSY